MTDGLKPALLNYYRRSYRGLWLSAFAQAFSGEYGHSAWLLGPSSYLFAINGLRFGLDICINQPWIAQEDRGGYADDLSKLDFMVLTHGHRDHYDASMLSLLKNTPVRWFIPAFFDREQVRAAGIAPGRITWVESGRTYSAGTLSIAAFDSPHVQVPETGYLVETGKARLLFPGDVRDYTQRLPWFGPVDYLFAHVWLGRGNARNLPCEPYLSGFCDFAMAARPRRVFLTHLFELGRDAGNLWTYAHAGLAADGLLARDASLAVTVPRVGDRLALLTK